MSALNTPAGQAFVLNKVEEIKPRVVFLDNRMSLLVGDMKDEVPWTETMPLVLELTRRKVAQVWIDHSGHDSGHIYGSKTKEWQQDVVILIEAATGGTEADVDVRLRFTKARRRRPETRSDFEPVRVTLKDDIWCWAIETDKHARPRVPPKAALFHSALQTAILKSSHGPGRTTRAAWMAECVRLNLVEPLAADDDSKAKSRKTQPFRTALMQLQTALLVMADGDYFTDLAATA